MIKKKRTRSRHLLLWRHAVPLHSVCVCVSLWVCHHSFPSSPEVYNCHNTDISFSFFCRDVIGFLPLSLHSSRYPRPAPPPVQLSLHSFSSPLSLHHPSPPPLSCDLCSLGRRPSLGRRLTKRSRDDWRLKEKYSVFGVVPVPPTVSETPAHDLHPRSPRSTLAADAPAFVICQAVVAEGC